MIAIATIQACETTVAPSTVQRVIQVESQGNALAINVNGAVVAKLPSSAAEAASLAVKYIQAGYSVDLGLMQVNSRNLTKLGYSVGDMFDTCKNIAAGSKILTDFYSSAQEVRQGPQSALKAALSAYNTGNFEGGFLNGYVAHYYNGARMADRANALQPVNPYTATTSVYARPQQETTMQTITKPVISTNENDAQKPGVQVEHTPEQAESYGAFPETAMTEDEAWDSNADLVQIAPPEAAHAAKGKGQE